MWQSALFFMNIPILMVLANVTSQDKTIALENRKEKKTL